MNTYLKPVNGTVVLDLSDMLGYGDQKLNAQTTLRVLVWRGLFSSTANGTSNLNLNLQGWSNTVDPQSYRRHLQHGTGKRNSKPATNKRNRQQLNSKLRHNTVPQAVTGITQGLQPVYEEYLLNVDANGKVTIIQVQPPTLCNIMAHII